LILTGKKLEKVFAQRSMISLCSFSHFTEVSPCWMAIFSKQGREILNATLMYPLAQEDLHNLLEKEYAPVKSA
jgi:hypothetical protein